MRKDYLDIAKGFGILLVILGHALELYLGDGTGGARGTGFSQATFIAWKFIYSFHMPLFFLLSGMATTRLAGVSPSKAASGALYLIIIAALLQLIVAPLRLTVPHSLPDALRTILWPAVKLESYALVVIWFLPCLALVRIAIWLVANGTRATATLCIATLGILCVIEHELGVGYFQLRSVIVAAAFFAIGQHAGDRSLERLPRLACWIGCACALQLTIVTFDLNHGCTFSPSGVCPGPRYGEFAVLMVSGAFGFLPLFVLTALAGAASILFASLLAVGAPGARTLALIGRRTLELLIVNGITLVFIQPHLAPLVSDIPPPLILPPLVLLEIAAALALHPILAPFLDLCRTLATRLTTRAVPATP